MQGSFGLRFKHSAARATFSLAIETLTEKTLPMRPQHLGHFLVGYLQFFPVLSLFQKFMNNFSRHRS